LEWGVELDYEICARVLGLLRWNQRKPWIEEEERRRERECERREYYG
jgi:hypothetical protein